MKIRNLFAVGACLFLCTVSTSIAGQFINLALENANYSGDPMDMQSSGLVSDLLPGWRFFYGTNEQFVVGFNAIPPGVGSFASLYNRFLAPTIEGQYSLVVGNPVGGPSWVLEQQGDVPPGTRMLSYTGTLWTVEVDGNVVPPIVRPINGGAINQVFYDFSEFAGKSVKLDFVSAIQSQDPFSKAVGGKLDSIAFVVAEPLFVENDFNGDGSADVVFEHPEGFVGVWFMNKGPDLISASYFNPQAVADPRWHIVGTGNFRENNTNKTDLLFQHEGGSLAVWSMHGTNLFEAALLNLSQPGEGWKVVGAGDMNHDGKKDILFQHTDGTLAVWFMDGINLVQGALLNPNKPGDSGWRVVGTANLTSAGNTDLIFQHSDGTLAAWYMNGINLVRGALLNPSAPGQEGWRVATTLDLNGDGKTDLLFQHADGTAAVWLMDGINLLSGHLLTPADPGTGWRIAGPK